MSQSVKKVLIVGGGFSGMSAAIELRKRGIEVDLVEIDPSWRAYGAGISIGGATLRAFKTLGILDRFLAEGWAGDGVDVHAPNGVLLATLPTPRIAGDEVPGNGAVMRPALAKILADATLASGTHVQLGCSFKSIKQDANGVTVEFTDGRSGKYDLVIGADGLYSKLRAAVLADAPKPKYSGQGVWRAVLPRDGIERNKLWISEELKIGVNPVDAERMYLFANENRATNEHVPENSFVEHLRGLLAQFPDPVVQGMREHLNQDSLIIFRPLEGLLVKRPWHVGRVVLIGDAVHATTPHLASGACIGIEDALVLAEEVGRVNESGADSVEAALDGFQQRRYERCRMVVENSARLGEIEIQHGDKAEHAQIMRDSFAALAAPI